MFNELTRTPQALPFVITADSLIDAQQVGYIVVPVPDDVTILNIEGKCIEAFDVLSRVELTDDIDPADKWQSAGLALGENAVDPGASVRANWGGSISNRSLMFKPMFQEGKSFEDLTNGRLHVSILAFKAAI